MPPRHACWAVVAVLIASALQPSSSAATLLHRKGHALHRQEALALVAVLVRPTLCGLCFKVRACVAAGLCCTKPHPTVACMQTGFDPRYFERRQHARQTWFPSNVTEMTRCAPWQKMSSSCTVSPETHQRTWSVSQAAEGLGLAPALCHRRHSRRAGARDTERGGVLWSLSAHPRQGGLRFRAACYCKSCLSSADL